MKNIHVLPTDKPSRLYLGDNGNFVFGIIQTSIQSRNDDFTNQNIYITSDEEIKEGDWVLFEGNDTIKKAIDSTFTSGVNNIRIHADKKVFKIILTTDGDLIKDGIQAIDDEFLQWFVENPSCEEVEVSEDYFKPSNMVYGHDMEPYKIIPKEEQKQDLPQAGTIEFVNMCESIFGGKRFNK
jgi:hypothetical protein